jgi:hypothetical protein
MGSLLYCVYCVESALTEAVNLFRVPEARRLSPRVAMKRPTDPWATASEQWDRGLGAELEKNNNPNPRNGTMACCSNPRLAAFWRHSP